MDFAWRGDVQSELERLGLRSSSERDRLMGRLEGTPRWKELLRGVVGCPGLEIDGSEDHGGTGGLLRFGDNASFLEDDCPGWTYGWGDAQSPDCCDKN